MASTTTSLDYRIIMRVDLSTIMVQNQHAVSLVPPKIHTLYSCLNNDKFSDEVHLPFFKEPKAKSYNLEELHKTTVTPNSEANFVLNKVEKYIMEAEENVLQPHKNTATEKWQTQSKNKVKVFLCQRGILADIMYILYGLTIKQYNEVTFYVTKYCGVFHMRDEIWTYNEREDYNRTFWQLCFPDNTDSDTTTDTPVNDLVYGIFKTVMKDFHLIYSAKIGGVKSKHKIVNTHDMDEINKLTFIETKLIKENSFEDDILYHPKSFLWFLQGYLANIKHICVGVMDENHTVHTPVQVKQIKDITKIREWRPDIYIGFLHTILKLIEKTMRHVDCPYTVYEFRYVFTENCIKLKKHNGKSEQSFLSEDYIKKCKQYTTE
ncbi:uncharacterized protein LOC105217240 [Zeugodacus cucurbitae]|uniref:uncharacterized protein LOC105217240 n=1 Tax=Zeugodacus cucurbitae TaxID=28588 RepID=UPI0023D90BF5|nr:uncharacterized protein LOC105217240 [Zeugodacus cucurbitae]